MDQIYFGPNLPNNISSLIEIYLRSKIDLNDYQRTCAYISIETTNNQNSINNMPFWIFNNYLVYVNKILEEKNGGDKGNEDAQKQYSSMMSQSKNMYRTMGNSNKFNFKPPKI